MKTNNTAADRALETYSNMFIEMLENASASDWRQPWINTETPIGMTPRSIAGRSYKGTNNVLLTLTCMLRNYKYPVFGTFKAFSMLNEEEREHIGVKKGEKGMPVLYWEIFYKHKDSKKRITETEWEALPTAERKEYEKLFVSRVFNVFNIEQTNMQDARPELWNELTTEPQDNTPRDINNMILPEADLLIEGNWICPINLGGDKAYFSPSQNFVQLPPRESFPDKEEFYGTMFHECAHSTAKPLGRELKGHFGDKDYATEECIAEMTAAFVCNHFGLSKYPSQDSAPYVKSWLGALHAEPKFIKTLLTEIAKASDLIISKMTEAITPPF